MSGHSKWASIKHKKAATDARRGQLFTKLARAISIAAREGGGDDERACRPAGNGEVEQEAGEARPGRGALEPADSGLEVAGGFLRGRERDPLACDELAHESSNGDARRSPATFSGASSGIITGIE